MDICIPSRWEHRAYDTIVHHLENGASRVYAIIGYDPPGYRLRDQTHATLTETVDEAVRAAVNDMHKGCPIAYRDEHAEFCMDEVRRHRGLPLMSEELTT